MNLLLGLILASWFSFLDPPIDRFVDAYASSLCVEVIEASTKRQVYDEMKLDEEREYMDRPSQYVYMDPRQAAEHSQRVNEYYERKSKVISDAGDARLKEVVRVCGEISDEYEKRKRLLYIHKATPDDQVSAALRRFKDGGCKLKKISQEDKNILRDYLLDNTSDWKQYYWKGSGRKRYLKKW